MDRFGMPLIVAALLGLGAGPVETLHVRVVGVQDSDTLTALTDRRDAILPKILSGDIRLPETEESVAAILT